METNSGESGEFGSKHYKDQFPEWYAGRGIALQLCSGKKARTPSDAPAWLERPNGESSRVPQSPRPSNRLTEQYRRLHKAVVSILVRALEYRLHPVPDS
jgi:hypothetical protein